jgi:hypothetical protein
MEQFEDRFPEEERRDQLLDLIRTHASADVNADTTIDLRASSPLPLEEEPLFQPADPPSEDEEMHDTDDDEEDGLVGPSGRWTTTTAGNDLEIDETAES